ncbi:hypothetical protein AB0N16_05825 [Streptomyces sp. NPDC051105]|uniref:NADPH-dependent F420 reductase n=1 Tax=Streptomyces sp. NPDC051105 TaxID=3154843 RepID=UPI003424BC4C
MPCQSVFAVPVPQPSRWPRCSSWAALPRPSPPPAATGKALIDISNPVDASLDALVVAPGTSAAEEIAEAVAPGSHVVKAFNTTFATTLVAGQVSGTPLDVFIAGDDEAARRKVADLVTSGRLNPVDVGALKHARELEGFPAAAHGPADPRRRPQLGRHGQDRRPLSARPQLPSPRCRPATPGPAVNRHRSPTRRTIPCTCALP